MGLEAGQLDSTGDSRYSRRGHELDAIQIMARAERHGWVAGALLRGGRPSDDGDEDEGLSRRHALTCGPPPILATCAASPPPPFVPIRPIGARSYESSWPAQQAQ